MCDLGVHVCRYTGARAKPHNCHADCPHVSLAARSLSSLSTLAATQLFPLKYKYLLTNLLAVAANKII